MLEPTKHFKNCLGVFQGGGCKALAFVGAFAEAYDRGVFFSALCGTSAGSIFAALIAAGATPEKLEALVQDADFKAFKAPANKKLFAFKKSMLMRLASLTAQGRAALRLGMYSSEYLETWLDEKLRELLGKTVPGPVTFSELNIPLHVVATHLGHASPKVWSDRDTPNDSVAFAVRCSCSIPVFFQPVHGTYVDGGVVSNLPAFALAQRDEHAFEKILCFGFDPDPQAPSLLRSPPRIELSPAQYLSELASATVDGAVAIQNGLQRNLHTISMGRLPLGTTDFDKVNKDAVALMFAAGRNAARSFFSSEAVNVKSLSLVRRVLATEAETLNEMARYEITSEDEILVLRSTNRWVYNLFPTFLQWSQQGRKLTFIRSSFVSPKQKDHEELRDLVLAGLGAEVRAADILPFEGVLVCRDGLPVRGLSFVSTSKSVSPGYAASYDRECDAPALSFMFERAHQTVAAASLIASPHDAAVSIRMCDTTELFNRLRGVEQYSGVGVEFALEEIDADRIVFLTRYVKSYKYTQVRHIFDLAHSWKSAVGQDVWIDYVTAAGAGFVMPMTPPVVEQHGDQYFLIEGNSRVTYALRELRQLKIRAVVVRGVSTPLPATAKFFAKQVLVSDEDRVGDTRYEGFKYHLYREIEAAARPPKNYAGVAK